MEDPDFRDWVDRLKAGCAGPQLAGALGLEGRGKRFFCPACQPQGGKTPDLAVSVDGFVCYKCGVKGDPVELVRMVRSCGFRDAVDWLSLQTGQQPPGPRRRRRSRRSARPSSPATPAPLAPRETPPRSNQSELYAAFLAGSRPVEGGALAYLTGRGIGVEVVERLGLRFCGAEYGDLVQALRHRFGDQQLLAAGLLTQGRRGLYPTFWPYFASRVGFLVIPYVQQGQPVYLKARPPCGKATAEVRRVPRFLNTGGAVPCLFNVDILADPGVCSVLICEGESDTMTALTHDHVAVGIPGWSHFKQDWTEQLRGKEVFLVMDADQAGVRGVRDIAAKFERAGLRLPRQVVLPWGKDLNEFFQTPKARGP